MDLLDKLRDFFNVELPEKVNNLIDFLIYDLGGIAWFLFIVFTLIASYFLVKLSNKIIHLNNLEIKINEFLTELSKLKKSDDVENKIFEFNLKTLQCRYSVLYELRGETYISVSSNTPLDKENQKIGISIRIPKVNVKKLNESGNYKIFRITSSDEKYMLLMYTIKNVNILKYEGTLKMAIGYYESIQNEAQITSDKKLAKLNEETMQAILKTQFGKEGYLKFLIAVILKIFKAKGGVILSHDGESNFVVGDTSFQLQKEFYIRNTPYKFKYYSDKEINLDEIREIGSFLDLSGSFLESLNQQSSIMQNYISFLKNATVIMENTTPFYEKHSEKIKVVAIEVAKNLFVDQATLNNIELAAELHDIGMVGDMEMIINQDNKLEKTEIDLIHYHPVIGSILLEPIAHLYPITNIVKQHHERYDGKGYPNGIAGSDISLDSQSLALAEHFIGLISDRSYRKGMEFEDAVEEVKKVSGKMFDPVVVKAFEEAKNKILKKIRKIEIDLDKKEIQ